MILIALKEYLNKDGATLPDVGRELYDIVKSSLHKSEQVQVDMSDVASLPSSLLNTFLGDLIKDFGFSVLKDIIFTNLTKIQAQRLVKYVDDVKEISGLARR